MTTNSITRRRGHVKITVPLRGYALVQLPYADDNRDYLEEILDVRPRWNPDDRGWLVARSRVDDVLCAVALDYDSVTVAREGRPDGTEKCDTRCRKAIGLDCSCSCMGVHHGEEHWQDNGWSLVGDTTLTRRGKSVWTVRTITRGEAA